MFVKFEPIINRTIRIALIGCGRISQKHITAILENSNKVKLVAICDPDESRLENAKKYIKDNSTRYEEPITFLDYNCLIEDSKKDNISI